MPTPVHGGLHGGEVPGPDLEEEADGGEVAGVGFQKMLQEVAGAGGVLIFLTGGGEGERGLAGEVVEEVEHVCHAAEALGGGEVGEEVVRAAEDGEVEAGLDGAGVLVCLGAGAGEPGQPLQVLGRGRRGGSELPPVELVVGVAAEDGLDVGDEGGGVAAEAGEGPGDVERGEVGGGAAAVRGEEGLEDGGGLGEAAGGEVEAGEVAAGGGDLVGAGGGGRVVQPVAEQGGGFVGLLGGVGGVEEGLDLWPGGGGVAGGLGEEEELQGGGLLCLCAGGGGLEEVEAEGVGFFQGELLDELGEAGEGGGLDAGEAGL